MNFQIGIAKAAPMIVAVHALGNILGAHFNPAVSIAFALAKRFFWKESESNAGMSNGPIRFLIDDYGSCTAKN